MRGTNPGKIIYDDYSEIHWTIEEVQSMLEKYLQWCRQNNLTPEVSTINDINENNIGHVVYHAGLI